MKMPKNWRQLDKDEEEHIFVRMTHASDPHYYDRSIELHKSGKGRSFLVIARHGRDKDAIQVLSEILPSYGKAMERALVLMEKGF